MDKNFKSVVDTVRGMYAPKPVQQEATMMKDDGKVVHNCAKHVEHATWGQGNCIAEEHADPDRYGNIAWYDVEFPHGVEKGVPVTELKVLAAENHGHATKKAKKMAEALAGDNSRNTENDKAKEAALEKVKADANATLDNQAIPGSVAGAKAGGEKELIKQGVREEEDLSKKIKGKAVTDAEEEDDEDDKMSCEENFKSDVAKGFPASGVKTQPASHKYSTMPKDKEKAKGMPAGKIGEEVDETIVYKTIGYEITEADANYDAHFKAHLKKAGIKNPGELKTPEEKKAFFNRVDAGFKAKNEDVFLEALMSADIRDRIKSHETAGHKVSDQASRMKNGEMEYSFVVTQPSGKRSRHIYHGSKVKHETMSPAPRSKEASEVGDDEDDK
jgi:hypothetical protein